MPHEYNNMMVVTREELVPAYYPTLHALQVKLSRDEKKPYGIKRAQRGGGAGCELLINYDTLPLIIREALGDPRRVDSCLERFYSTDAAAVAYFSGVKRGGVGLDATTQNECAVNAQVLNALIALRDERKRERVRRGQPVNKGLWQSLCDDAIGFNTILRIKHDEEHNLPTNERRLKEKIEDYEKLGYECLITSKFGNKNASKRTDEIAGLLESMFKNKDIKPSATDVARQYDAFIGGYVELINTETGEQYNPKEFKKLSNRTITSFLAGWQSSIATRLGRGGNRQKYMSEYEAFVSLKHPEYAGSIISIDDRNPPFWYEKGKRIWFYNAIDLGSEAFTCWVWGKTKEGIILDFYRELVRNYTEWGFNLPAELECESSLNSSFKNTFLKPGNMFSYVRIEANKARAKRIERYYGNLRYDIERAHPGWLGRPNAIREANEKRSDEVIIPYNQLVKQCLGDIQIWNNMPHSIYKDKTRWEVFCEKQNPNLSPTNWKGILPYLGDKASRTCRAANIKIGNTYYLLGDEGKICTGDDLIAILTKVEQKQLDIRYLTGHNGQMLKALAYINDKYVCELIEKPLVSRAQIEQTDQDRANMEIVSAYNNTITGYARKRKNNIEPVIVIDNREVTLNNKFQIFELTNVDEPGYLNVDDEREIEILEEDLELELNAVTMPFQRQTLGDRF
jgi:hypothetical protein